MSVLPTRAVMVLIALLPAAAPASPCQVRAGDRIRDVAIRWGVDERDVGAALWDLPLSMVVESRPLFISRCRGAVDYKDDEVLRDVAKRCGLSLEELASDEDFVWTRLQVGVFLTLPNPPPEQCDLPINPPPLSLWSRVLGWAVSFLLGGMFWARRRRRRRWWR